MGKGKFWDISKSSVIPLVFATTTPSVKPVNIHYLYATSFIFFIFNVSNYVMILAFCCFEMFQQVTPQNLTNTALRKEV